MSQYEIVKYILENLRKEEIRSLRRYLQLFEEGSDTNQLKSLTLLELLLNKKNYPEEKACKKIYNDASSTSLKTFNKMLLRFKEKIFELLVLDINLYRKDGYDDLTMAVSKVRKMLLQVTILEGKAPSIEIGRLYDKIKQLARSYELYDELLLALSGKINLSGSQIKYPPKTGNITEVLFFDRCRHSLLKAREVYFLLVQQKSDNQSSADNLMYEKAIEELEHEYRYTKSASIGYILYDLSSYFHQSKKNFDAAERSCHRMITIISENPAVYRNERMTKAFIRLAAIEVYRYSFKQAETTLSRALFYSKDNETLTKEVDLISFHTLFYKGNYEKAGLLVSSKLLNLDLLSSLEISRNCFFLAAVNTVLGKTHEAQKQLQQTAEIEKEHPAWNASSRLLVIMNFLETEKFDLVESHIENFRKFLERSAKAGFSNQRFLIIVKLLSHLVNESFNYRLLWEKEKDTISTLESNIPDLVWQPMSPELIIFPVWLHAKASQKSYYSIAQEWFEHNRKSTLELTLFD